MIIGNQQAQEHLARYFKLIQEGAEVTFPFLLLTGPQHVGKTSVVEKYVQDLLGLYASTDYLPLYDLSDKLGKAHSLKVEIAPKDQRVTIEDEYFVDMGTRDIVQRLALSSVGTYKVVFLENIERMTISAANAFLKTFEEPLPNRLIIATTSNKDALLDTIISRAFVVPFHIPAAEVVREHLTSRYPEKNEAQRLFASSFSLGRVGLAKQMLETGEDLEEMSASFMELVSLLTNSPRSVVRTVQLIQQLQASTGAEALVDALLYAGVQQEQYQALGWLMKARNMMSSNVNTDNILFGLAMG